MKIRLLISCLMVAGLASLLPAKPVLLVTDPELPPAARYGLAVLEKSLHEVGAEVTRTTAMEPAATGDRVVAGIASSAGPALRLLRAHQMEPPGAAEGLVVRRLTVEGRPVVVICGADARGLMYGALDSAEQIRRSKGEADWSGQIRDAREAPVVKERAVSTYTMQRRWFEQRLYDEEYWKQYFGMLAASRINSFVVIFGYENGGFLAPLYPYFFNVEGFPGVEMVGLGAAQQEQNLKAFKRMIVLAHERGVAVTAGIWDHIYRGAVQGGGIAGADEAAGKRVEHLVSGVTSDNLVTYNKAALTKFLRVFPEIDGLQLRMHWESGLTRQEIPVFWHDMFAIIKETCPNLRIDLRAKDLPDSVIDDALDQGLNIRIATKYWMEQMGLPFHPSHINRQNQHDRRHGYADLLVYPKRYPMHWRLWNGGTTRCLLWGDPDYVRRFVASVGLYGGESFEINEMLATKMLGEDHHAEPFELLNPRYRFYQYEFERYWYFYQVWGRLGYNPAMPEDGLRQGFVARFGPACGPSLMRGLHLASKVLPRIVAAAYDYRNFPTTRGWAEMMRQGDLPQFAKAEGSDIGQFVSFADEARLIQEGGESAMRRPAETCRWFGDLSDSILKEVAAADRQRPEPAGGEFVSTMADLRILAHLARFYAERIPAAVSYNRYLLTKDPAMLGDAIRQERKAVEAWRDIVRSAGDVYNFDLAFGVERVGFPRHWRDELVKLETGLEKLEAGNPGLETDAAKPVPPLDQGDQQAPVAELAPVKTARAGSPLEVSAQVKDPSGVKWVRLRYRHLTQFEDYQTVEMRPAAADDSWSGTIPGDFIDAKWDLMYFIEVMDKCGNGRIYPDMEREAPYVIVALAR